MGSKDIIDIIKNSSFSVEDGRFVYTKVKDLPDLSYHFMVSKDKDEITVVTKEENINTLSLLEKNKDFYKLICLNVSLPFYAIGFLATVSGAIAKNGMNILIISTYSKDYILIKEDKINDAKDVLLNLGFKEK